MAIVDEEFVGDCVVENDFKTIVALGTGNKDIGSPGDGMDERDAASEGVRARVVADDEHQFNAVGIKRNLIAEMATSLALELLVDKPLTSGLVEATVVSIKPWVRIGENVGHHLPGGAGPLDRFQKGVEGVGASVGDIECIKCSFQRFYNNGSIGKMTIEEAVERMRVP